MQSIRVRRTLALGTVLLATLGGGSAYDALSAASPTAHPSSEVAPAHARTTAIAGGRVTARWSGALDTSSRTTVERAYRSQYAAGDAVATGWTGNLARCAAGDSSAASRAATLRAVNFARSLVGVAPVSFSGTLNARSQRTALIMGANRSLSHAPPRSWRCWSESGAANAGRSNLALSYPSITSAGLVGLYLGEPGANNRAVGHRRWLLNPFATQMGSGSTDTANAMTVIGPTSTSRPNPRWVPWPMAGWFPSPLEPGGRWSLSAGDGRTSFARATVAVTRDGAAVRVTRNRVENGYARPTLVWQLPAGTARSGTFRVVVRGIRVSGTSKVLTASYTVRMFAPTR